MLHSMLDAAGIQTGRIEALWWVMFWVTLVVTVIAIGMLAWAVIRGRQRAGANTPDRHLYLTIGGATVATIVILFVLLVTSIVTSRALASE